MEKQLRCKDCKRWCVVRANRKHGYHCILKGRINPGQFACKKFVYKDK